ncbi:hypothetical protein [Pseudalkalibacillus caeni]|uniref:UDP-glucose 4-epimerase n=1 Tax=Exobacillus caeni TaxID=2574798 RepID=A0A5R9F050_9BACL|nr:hypothetical protein [Pseudalkalibacillus caeni]TLS35780.1 hypothetical protein FCL54_18365 [Pseudalkalibacillus caeni]
MEEREYKVSLQASGKSIPSKVVTPMHGDATICYADPTKPESDLGWEAKMDILEMCKDSWRWQEGNPDGYKTEYSTSHEIENPRLVESGFF